MKNDKIGLKNSNYQGLEMTIIKYDSSKDVTVEFEEMNKIKEIVKTRYACFNNGQVKCRYSPSMFNVAYLGNSITQIGQKDKESYKSWFSMIRRCYDEKYKKKHLTYIGCTVCEEWHNYSVFEKWYDKNYYEIGNEKMVLDKDILTKGNKIYSPKTCVFASQRINALFIQSDKMRGKNPIGVNYNKDKWAKNKYRASISCMDARKSLGSFSNPEEAFDAYKIAKEKYIKEIADEYKYKIPQKLYDAMHRYEVEITD